jgi:hypothetical protein
VRAINFLEYSLYVFGTYIKIIFKSIDSVGLLMMLIPFILLTTSNVLYTRLYVRMHNVAGSNNMKYVVI